MEMNRGIKDPACVRSHHRKNYRSKSAHRLCTLLRRIAATNSPGQYVRPKPTNLKSIFAADQSAQVACHSNGKRGADSDGFVANFVESEQIIQLKGYTISLFRGSIPLLWNQIVDLTYKYKFEMVRIVEAP
ncbi:uncharacterized protein [Solanum lycopersicum]|uniref:uncharacterized protein n=1 Tax=Solanum lycopersicum TaxID=4081 RepID=UPI003749CD49